MRRALLLLVAIPTACGGDGGSGGADAAPAADAVSDCSDPTALLPPGWTPIATVSGGEVTSTQGGAITTIVDASAGGFGGSASEPFVYLDLQGGQATKVSIDDEESYRAASWDLGLKRYVIRANGGDSGPGGVEVAVVEAASINDVNSAPPSAAFATDDFVDEACRLRADDLGAPVTTFSEWYNLSGMGVLSPLNKVYVVRLRDDSLIKLEIDSYYADATNPGKSGLFRLVWSAL